MSLFSEISFVELVSFLSYMFDRVHQWRHLGLKFSLRKAFNYKLNYMYNLNIYLYLSTYSYSSLLFKFTISYWVSILVICICQEICLFNLNCWIYWYKVVHNIPLFSFFMFQDLWWHLSFCSWYWQYILSLSQQPDRGVFLILLNFSKNQLWVSLISLLFVLENFCRLLLSNLYLFFSSNYLGYYFLCSF